jgi:hypothetical protein
MRKVLAGLTAIGMVAGLSAPALSKAHKQPADRAQELGQANADATMPTGARNGDARMLTDSMKGVDGRTYSDLRSSVKGTESGQKSGDMAAPGSPK